MNYREDLKQHRNQYNKLEVRNQYDELDIFDKIIKSLGFADTNKYDNATMLACHIIDRCAGNIVDEALTENSKFQFIDYFDKSIDNLMERQRKLLNQLDSEIKQGTHEVPSMETPSNIEVGSEIKQETREIPSKETPFNIEDEFDILKEIRDIEEEIHMMIHVVEQQMYAIRQLERKQRHIAEDNPLDDIPFENRTLAPWSQKSQHIARKFQRNEEEQPKGNDHDLLIRLADSLAKIAGAFVTESGKKPFVQTLDLGREPRDTVVRDVKNKGTQTEQKLEQDVPNSTARPLKERIEKARFSVADAASRAAQRTEDRLAILQKMYHKAEHVERSVKA